MTDPVSAPRPDQQKPQSNSRKAEPSREPTVIKKYANRRLYNTASSTYVTLESLAEMVRDNIDFMVVDAKTGDDLTRPVLTQIIVEQEAQAGAQGTNLLPISFLRQLIGMYGDNMQVFVPNYLEQTMQHFTDNQQKLQDYLQQTFGSAASPANMASFFPFMGGNPMARPTMAQPMETLQAVSKQMVDQQKAIFEQAQKFMGQMFGSFGSTTNAAVNSAKQEATETLDALKAKVARMEAELKNLGD